MAVFPIYFFPMTAFQRVMTSYRNLLISIIAIDRFIAVGWPLKSVYLLTKRNTYLALLFCLFVSLPRVSFVFWAGDLWSITLNPCSGKWQIFTDRSIWWIRVLRPILIDMDTWHQVVIALGLPVCICGVMDIALGFVLRIRVRERARIMANTRPDLSAEYKKVISSATNTLILTLMFFILQAPQVIPRVLGFFQRSLLWGKAQIFLFYIAQILTGIDMDNDFLILFVLNKKYRNHIRGTFSRK